MSNYFLPLKRDLKERLLTPIGHPSYWVFFIGGVIFFGGAGVWYEIFATKTFASIGDQIGRVISSVITYFPAVAGISVLQGILGEKESYMRGFFTFMAIFLLTPSAYLLFGDPSLTAWTIILVIFCTIVSLLLAWVISANQVSILDHPVSTVGGDTADPLSGDGKF